MKRYLYILGLASLTVASMSAMNIENQSVYIYREEELDQMGKQELVRLFNEIAKQSTEDQLLEIMDEKDYALYRLDKNFIANLSKEKLRIFIAKIQLILHAPTNSKNIHSLPLLNDKLTKKVHTLATDTKNTMQHPIDITHTDLNEMQNNKQKNKKNKKMTSPNNITRLKRAYAAASKEVSDHRKGPQSLT